MKQSATCPENPKHGHVHFRMVSSDRRWVYLSCGCRASLRLWDPAEAAKPPPDETELGRKGRDEALASFDEHRAGIRDEIDREMRRLYRERVAEGVEQVWVNGDDASRYLDAIGYTGERRVIGSVFGQGRGWSLVTHIQSQVGRRHARPIACWRPSG